MTPSTFHPTRWTLVLQAHGKSDLAKRALSDLCAAYYEPVNIFLRREGRSDDAARELAHEFFAQLLLQGLGTPDPERGRFRNYLLGALKHFLTKHRAAHNTQKRGGMVEHVSLDEAANHHAFADPGTTSFDREWALTLIHLALQKLESEHAERIEFFHTLKPWLDGAAQTSQATAALELGMSETAVKVAIHRLRTRFREFIRQEVAATVADEADVSDELRHLISSARNG